MKNFERVYEIAADRHGLITVEDAAELGIHRKQLLSWEAMGRLERCGRGVYRLNYHVPTPYDHFAEAVALVGRGSVIYGDGVLAMHNLALVNPPQIQVAVARRVRRNLPKWIRLVKKTDDLRVESFEGIACQSVADAIRTCRGTVMRERLLDAIDQAEQQGLLGRHEYMNLKEEFAK
jgi:predicted transcriptional regulator of viral defense system